MDNDTIEINGVQYVRADSVQAAPSGDRCVVVLDRGWIFAGTITEDDNGRVRMANVVNVRKWSGVGFEGMIADPKSSKVEIKKLSAPLDYPIHSELFRVPVPLGWGQ